MTQHKQDPDIYVVDENTVRIVFSTAPGTDAMRVRVIGFNKTPISGEGGSGGGGGGDSDYVWFVGPWPAPGDDTVYKVDLSGVEVWAAQETCSTLDEHQNMYAVATDPSGRVYVGGANWESGTISTSTFAQIAAMDTNGAVLWRTDTHNTEVMGLAAVGTSSVAVAHGDTVFAGTSPQMSVTLLDRETGAIEWQRHTGDYAYTVASDSDCNIYVGGAVVSGVSIWAYGIGGNTLWAADYGATVRCVAVDPTQTYVYAGGNQVSGIMVRRFMLDTGTESTSAQWPILAGTATIGRVYGVAVDTAGALYVTAKGTGGSLGQVRSYSTSGGLVWSTEVSGGGDPYAVALSKQGQVFVSDEATETTAAAVRVFASATGAESTDGWPFEVQTTSYFETRAIAVSPGPVGAFPSEWGL